MKKDEKNSPSRNRRTLIAFIGMLVAWCAALVFMLLGSFGVINGRPSGFLYAAAVLGIINCVRQIGRLRGR